MTGSAPGRSDAELVARLVAGDEDALGELYERHADSVFRAAFRLLGDRGQAEDVLQETVLALWNRAETYDPAVASVTAWLMAIARNRAVDRLRARGRRPLALPLSATFELAGGDEAAEERVLAAGILVGAGTRQDDPEVAADIGELRAAVRTALATIPPAEREALELAYYQELTQTEIARRLDWPLGTVKTRTRRALLRLRVALADTLGAELAGRVAPAPLPVREPGPPPDVGSPPDGGTGSRPDEGAGSRPTVGAREGPDLARPKDRLASAGDQDGTR